jgi:nucleotide-binding universal stress UspA family protein
MIVMGGIVVGVDGSDEAQEALLWALEEGRLRDADVTVVYAYLPNPADFYGFPGAVTAEQMEAIVGESDTQAKRTVEDVIERAGDAARGVRVTTDMARGFSASEALVERSRTADLLVVGSRGRGGFRGMLLGSVSQQVAQHAHCPVVIIGKRG